MTARDEIRELLVEPPQFRDEDRPLDGTFEAETSDMIREQAADDILAAYRAEVLREAADFIDNDDDCDCGGCDSCIPRRYANDLRAMADTPRP